MSDNIEAPDGWHYGVGSRSPGYYTYWLYTNLRFHYQAQMFWDEGQQHTVQFFEETGLRNDGDVKVAGYPCVSRSFDTEEEALEFLHEKAEDLIDY